MLLTPRTFLQQYSGFTLVELVVVILILGILSVSIAPRFFGVASYEERKATDEILLALRHTQQMSMNRGGNIELVITANNYSIQVSGGNPVLRSPEGLPYPKDFDGVNAIPSTVRFNTLGQPIDALGVSFTNNISLVIGTNIITIQANTGYATSP